MELILDPKINYEPNSSNKKNFYEKQHGKFIYKVRGKWQIRKSINGEPTHFGTFHDFKEAMDYRDQQVKHNWTLPPYTSENLKEIKYYQNIQLRNGRQYAVVIGDDYKGQCKDLCDALYYRDQIRNNPKIKHIKECENTGNPYTLSNLEFPIPERLRTKDNYWKPDDLSYINCKGEQSFSIYKQKDKVRNYYGAYRTLHMAKYVRDKLIECNWNMNCLTKIKQEYPEYYTYCLKFYKGISYQGHLNKPWVVQVVVDGNNETLTGFSQLEEALWERDLLLEYGDDTISYAEDTRPNPYYEKELPYFPFVRRKKYQEKADYSSVIEDLYWIICEEPGQRVRDYAELLGYSRTHIYHALKKYNVKWGEFVQIVESGENPMELLEQKKDIVQPDLTYHASKTNYVHYHKKGVRCGRYNIQRRGIDYGTYTDKKTANRVAKELQKNNWDKSKLKTIREKLGCPSIVNSKRWIYKDSNGKGYTVRRKNKEKRMCNYGHYTDYRVASIVRDSLIKYGFNGDKEYLKYKKFAENHVQELDKQNIEYVEGTVTYTPLNKGGD